MQRAYLCSARGQLHYRHSARPELPPLLLLHQSPSDSRMFEGIMPLLESRFWVIAPDSPGFGQSDALPGGFSLWGCCELLEELLDALSIAQCCVAGHHTGAAIAVEFSARHPSRVSALALSGPTLLNAEFKAALPGKAAPFAEQADGSHLLGMWQRMAGKDAAAGRSVILREVLSAFAAGDAYQQSYEAVIEQDFANQLSSLTIPVLVFAGTDDVLYGRLQASFEALQDGQMEVIEGAGGYLFDAIPTTVAALLQDFFTGKTA